MAKSQKPTQRTCGTAEVHERLLRTVPGYKEAREASENHAWRSALSPLVGRTGCTKIPVVVHVVWKTPQQNISDAQIHSQIDVLNADFRKKNADVSTIPTAFQPLAADSRIEFELATTDPSGNPSGGIVRKKTTKSSFSGDDGVKSSATGGADPWPSDKYLNIWVCQLDGILGYAQFPGGPAATDGVVILHSAFGTTGTAAAPFDLGRTTTHEIGHWLNLRHIWGDDGTGCWGSDFVADTPNQGGPNFGKPTFPNTSCSNAPQGDLFMDFMDYVDDDTMVMFTTGQVARMHDTLDSTRISIGTNIPCDKAFAKDPPKELPKDSPKDHPFDPPKGILEPPKHVLEPPKGVLEPPKHVLEPPKGVLEPPKGVLEPPKGVLEPPKGVFEPPKGVLDPPKSFFEPPMSYPSLTPGPYHGPGIPFVLATPASGATGYQDAARQQTTSAYLQLLAHYAQLYTCGMLDAAGLLAWQNAASTYRQLFGNQ